MLNASKLAITLVLTEPPVPFVPLALHLFGPFVASVQGVPLPRLRSGKGQWLLALLALRNGRALGSGIGSVRPCGLEPGSEGAGEPAPQEPPGPAAGVGRGIVAISGARPAALCRSTSQTPRSMCSLSTPRSPGAIGGGVVEAVNLYAGPLLEGCLEEWVFAERDRCGRKRIWRPWSGGRRGTGNGERWRRRSAGCAARSPRIRWGKTRSGR